MRKAHWTTIGSALLFAVLLVGSPALRAQVFGISTVRLPRPVVSVIAASHTDADVPRVRHSVTLSWNACASTVIGYNVYRGGTSGGPYTRLNSSVDILTTFTDSTAQAGGSYYYVVTSVDPSYVESEYSTEMAARIPNT